ncbi:MAG: hypothetical protein HOV81_29630 [Kofleriaceae bacterium]|nr:hypothetical protein [Kofleriaceae bacterium]
MDPAVLLALHEEDYPQLRDAFAAFRARDWRKFVGHCIYAANIDRPHAESRGDVHYWGVACGSALMVISLDLGDNTIAIDAPIVDIRPETEVALLRAALSMPTGPARAARRGDRLVLTKVHRIESMPPPRLVYAISDMARAADQLDNLFALEFGVRMIGPGMRKGHLFDLSGAGTPRRLLNLEAATKPVALRPVERTKQPSAGYATTVTADSVARFLDVVREAGQLVVSLGFTKDAPTDDEAILHVALALRAAHAGGLEADASRLLLNTALQLRTRAATPSAMRPLYPRLLQDRGHCQPQRPAGWARIVPEQVKSVLAGWVTAAARFQLTAHRRVVLLGGLCELIMFAELPANTVERLRALHASSLGTDGASVDTLHRTLESISR